MPSSMFSLSRTRDGSFDSSQTSDSLQSGMVPGVFNLPMKFKHVTKHIHRSEPGSLPNDDADCHEVRYFLYQLLTLEEHRVAKIWPQWVLETCASWNGTGANLRRLSEMELSVLCPLNSGHCTLDHRERPSHFPPPECRKQIGQVLSMEIKKLKAREDTKAKLHREWKKTQLGSSATQRAIEGLYRGHKASEDLPQRPSLHLLPPVQEPRSTVSAPVAFAGSPHSWPTGPYASIATSAASTFKPASISPFFMQQQTSSPISCSGPLSPMTSGQGSHSSATTNSTMKTSPPGSIEEQLTTGNGLQSPISPQSFHNPKFGTATYYLRPTSSVPQLPSQSAREILGASVDQDSFRDGNLQFYSPINPPRSVTPHPSSSLYSFEQTDTAGLAQGNPAYEQTQPTMPYTNVIYHSAPYMQNTRYHQPRSSPYSQLALKGHFSTTDLATLPSQQLPSRAESSKSLYSHREQSPTPDDSISVRGMHLGNQSTPTWSSYNGATVHSQHSPPPSAATALGVRNTSEPSYSRRAVDPRSMNYPRPDISGPRGRVQPMASSAASVASSRARSIAPSIIRQNPISMSGKIPTLNTFRGPNSGAGISETHRFALEQGQYIAFRNTPSHARNEVVRAEVKRMHNMVPSKMLGDGIEHVGPGVRFANPSTGQPMSTLVETIHDIEVLKGKKQRGSDMCLKP